MVTEALHHRLLTLVFLIGFMLTVVLPASAAPISVRFAEGATHGYLLLRDERGDRLADGEMIQKTRGDLVESQLMFHFKDGSLHDERVSFTQKRVFSLQSYKLIQRGPSFPATIELAMDRKTGEYRVQSSQDGSVDPPLIGRLELPGDVSNGLVVTLLRNLVAGSGETVHFIAFMPEPKVIELKLIPSAKTTVHIGDLVKQMTQYVLEPQLNSVTMFFGKLLGKLPRAFHYHFWLLTDDVPAFGGFEGPLYLNGPTWRIEQTTLSNLWPSQTASAKEGPH
ncbi:MAG: hypothetical protein H0W13_01255 [Nitrospirales bacterium]|nr:hypothetical protein [Nitrospirales bacterium]